jgi:hypothetical protein
MRLILQFFLALFGFWLASLAAAAVLVLGAAAPELPPPDSLGILTIFILIVSAFVVAFSFVPSLVVVLLAETFGLRSILFHAAAGALVALFCGYTLGFIEPMPRFDWDIPLSTNLELMAAAGIAGGFVYWLVAGRTSGTWRDIAISGAAAR